MSMEGFHPSDRFGRFDETIERGRLIVTVINNINQGLRQEVRQMRGDTNRTHTRTAAAVGDGAIAIRLVHEYLARNGRTAGQ